MNPNTGEPVNPGGVAVADKPVSPVGQSPIGVAPSQTPSPDISRVEDLVAAAQEAAAQTPKGQFENQFGSEPANPQVEESNAPDLMGQALAGLGTPPPAETPKQPENPQGTPVAQLDPSIKTVDDLLEQGPQVVDSNPIAETAAPSENTPDPRQKLKADITAAVDAFLAEVTKETKEEVVV